MSFLVDTSVISELTKRRPNDGAIAWLGGQSRPTISAITVDELSFGVRRAPKPQRPRLTAWLDALLAAAPQVVAIDVGIARMAGELRATAADRGRSLSQPDALVAACALASGLTLATRNVRDFRGIGVALFDPFT